MVFQQTLRFSTKGRGTYNISQQVDDVISKSNIQTGICQVFIHHTSASLILCENADPTVRSDLEAFMKRLVPDGDTLFKHKDEGDDDMPAHIRTVLTDNSISIPISEGEECLGMWQGIFLWEHRTRAHKRTITVTIIGD